MIAAVMYQVGEGQKFDVDYYMKSHIPLVKKRLGPAGMKDIQVLHGTGSASGGPASYRLIALLEFDSMQTFGSAMEANGPELMGDIPNFTDTQPTIQFNDKLT